MADRTSIEWTDATWNPIVGCSVVSPGCTNCYAMRLAGTRLKHHPSRAGLTVESKAGPVWTGETHFDEKALTQPLRWRRPRKIFVCAHSDLFHDATPDEWIDRIFAVMALCPQHTFQVLTKRPGRMRQYVSTWFERASSAETPVNHPTGRRIFADLVDWSLLPKILPNVWLGVTTEDQTRADDRVTVLLGTPAAKRFVSVEPMLGMVNLRRIRIAPNHHTILDALEGYALTERSSWSGTGCERTKLDWVICGGESGPGARPMHPNWVRSLRDQCAAAGVPFLFKQWGEWVSVLDRSRDDPDWRADYTNEFDHRNGSQQWLNVAGGMGFHGDGFHVMRRVGKRAAGRSLDGIEHNAFPEQHR